MKSTKDNHAVDSFKTRLRAEIVARRKTLHGAGFIAVMLLYGLVGWSQSLAYRDEIAGGVLCGGKTEASFEATGSTANDYALAEGTGLISCGTGGNGSANAEARVGSFLNAYAHLTTGEDNNDHSPSESATAIAKDTVQLIPATGFTGQSIKIRIAGVYILTVVTSGSGSSATVCWKWTVLSKVKCDSTTKGSFSKPYSSTIVVNKDKTTKQFQFYVNLSSGVSGSGAGGATAGIGTPSFTLPLGWTYTWASGESP